MPFLGWDGTSDEIHTKSTFDISLCNGENQYVAAVATEAIDGYVDWKYRATIP